MNTFGKTFKIALICLTCFFSAFGQYSDPNYKAFIIRMAEKMADAKLVLYANDDDYIRVFFNFRNVPMVKLGKMLFDDSVMYRLVPLHNPTIFIKKSDVLKIELIKVDKKGDEFERKSWYGK